MKIAKKIKLGLDETRMLVLGAQVLVGFQFRGAFEEGFQHLPRLSRYLDAMAMLLMILTFGLLILPGLYQRVVEHGLDSERLHRFTGHVAAIALAPFATSLGLDIGIATERIWGAAGGIAAGAATGLLAVACWYGLEALPMRSRGHEERAMSACENDKPQDPGLHEKIDQMLTEARVILPGAQALLGFQLAIVISASFEELSPFVKSIHGAALLFVAVSIVLLMAPAAYHRMVYAGEESEDFLRTGSRFVTWSTLPLALGLAADVYVVCTRIFAADVAAGATALAVLALLLGLWYALPLALRRRQRGKTRHAAQGSWLTSH
jgi:Family of unknown function (DUF6328)